MKKSILVLSALLTLVVSGICLQSCSSEYDEYTTEEYGYYTEEEIAAIKALGEKYGVNINIDENTYEVKKTLAEFEEDIQLHASLIGEYEIVLNANNRDGVYLVRKKNDVARATTRASEKGGTWNYSFDKGAYKFYIDIKWTESASNTLPGSASGTFEAHRNIINYYGSLHCGIGPKGSDTVTFGGSITLGFYTFYITEGSFSITTKNGSFYFDNEPYTVYKQ